MARIEAERALVRTVHEQLGARRSFAAVAHSSSVRPARAAPPPRPMTTTAAAASSSARAPAAAAVMPERMGRDTAVMPSERCRCGFLASAAPAWPTAPSSFAIAVNAAVEHVRAGAFPQQAARPAARHDDVVGRVRAGPHDAAEAARLARRQAAMQREIGDHGRMSAGGGIEIVGRGKPSDHRSKSAPSATIQVPSGRTRGAARSPPTPRLHCSMRWHQSARQPRADGEMRMRVDEARQHMPAAKCAPFGPIRTAAAADGGDRRRHAPPCSRVAARGADQPRSPHLRSEIRPPCAHAAGSDKRND